MPNTYSPPQDVDQWLFPFYVQYSSYHLRKERVRGTCSSLTLSFIPIGGEKVKIRKNEVESVTSSVVADDVGLSD